MMKPECILLVGPPGSGKSTYRNNFDEDFTIISSDDYIQAAADLKGTTYDAVFKDEIDEASKKADADFKAAVKDYKNILIDRTNMTIKSRRKYLSQLSKDYIQTAIVFLAPCMKEFFDKDIFVPINPGIDFKYNERLLAREGKRIPASVIYDMYRGFEMPDYGEEPFDNIFVTSIGNNCSLTPIDSREYYV
jgi:tRNA uridine 5-carbamoylmethylation protein Kti12